MSERTFVPLVCIGLAGVHFDYLTASGSASCSGCGPLDYWMKEVHAGRYSTRKYGEPLTFVGAVVIDKRVPLDANPGFCFASPLVDLKLSPGEIDRFADFAKGSFVADAFRDPACTNAYGELVRLADKAHERGVSPGPLDSVDLQTYARWWRARGAVIGRIVGEGDQIGITWHIPPPVGVDTGTETPVLPELAAQGVDPIIPYCPHCQREGHLLDECPEIDRDWFDLEDRRVYS